jgi:hypothetical protein
MVERPPIKKEPALCWLASGPTGSAPYACSADRAVNTYRQKT